jgi:hypothetical protein
MKYIILLLSIFGLSCNLPPGHHYTVYMDGFTTSQQQSILNAMDDWHSKIPILTFDPVIGSCSGVHDREICIHPGTSAQIVSLGGQASWGGATKVKFGPDARGDTTGYFGTDGGESWLNIDLINKLSTTPAQYAQNLQTTAEHEIGHGMSLEHHMTYCLMNPVLQNGAPVATADDIIQWYYVRE